MKAATWTVEDDLYLQEHYAIEGVKRCAEALGRSPGAVSNRAHRIGLGRMKAEKLRFGFMGEYPAVRLGTYRARIHILVAEHTLGRCLRPDEVVHHKDGNKWNISPDNLLVVTRSKHMKIHAKAHDEKTGRFKRSVL